MAVYYEVYEGSNSLPTYFFKEEWAHYSPLYRWFTKMWIEDSERIKIIKNTLPVRNTKVNMSEFIWLKLIAQPLEVMRTL